MAAQIETENLGRYFGEIRAVDGITFSASKGEVLGFLGPNGAGKSTTMKVLTCFLSPSLGSARIGGYDICEKPREVRALVGYLPENAPIYGEMRVRDFLRFVAEVRGFRNERITSAVDRVISVASLQGVVNQRVETLSKGFKRRVGLAQALIHDPEILILDEPTDGLDPNQKYEVRQLILGMAKEKTILLSTHILEEVDAVCSRAIIIAQGKILADATPDELRKRSKRHGCLTVAFRQPSPDDLVSRLSALQSVAQVSKGSERPTSITFILMPKNDPIALTFDLLDAARANHWQLEEVRTESGELDEVFRAITQ